METPIESEEVVEVVDDVVVDDVTDVKDEDVIDVPDDDISDDVVKGEDPAPSDTDPDPVKKKGGVQKRIDKLTKRAAKAELDAAYYRGLAEGKADANKDITSELDPKPTPKLSRDDFDTEEDYLDAAVDLRLKKKETATTAKGRIDTVNAQYVDAREKYDDFDEVALADHLPITEPMFEASMGENLTEILYHLGKNPELASRIARMAPMQAAKEISKVEIAIVNAEPKPKIKKEPKPSKAPDPVPKIKPTGTPATDEDKDSQKTRMAKWDKEREDRIKAGGRA